MRNLIRAFEEMDVSYEDLQLRHSSTESTFDASFQQLLVAESFLTAARETGISQSMIDLVNLSNPAVVIPSCEESLDGENYSPSEICMIAEENWLAGVGPAIAAFSAAVVVPLNAIRTLDVTFTKTIQDASAGIGKITGTVQSKVSKDQAKLILNGMEAAAAIAILYYSGIGGAVVKAAKSPAFAETFVGNFITKITQFKWPFGSFKAGIRKTGKAFVDFYDDMRGAAMPHLSNGYSRMPKYESVTTKHGFEVFRKKSMVYDPADPIWKADAIPSFSRQVKEVFRAIVYRLKNAVMDGVSSFYHQFNGVIVKPIVEKTRTLGLDAGARAGSVAAGRIVTFALRSIASFGLMVITRFVYRVLHQGISFLRNTFKGLYHEVKTKLSHSPATA